jgi:hypothetical protein
MKMNKVKNLYERLPAFIRHKKQGFDYSLVMRDGRIAWYEARYLKGSELVGYIVIKIRTKKASKLPSGYTAACREVFPSPSEYGKMGWFYMPTSRSASEAHFMELVEADKKEMKAAA